MTKVFVTIIFFLVIGLVSYSQNIDNHSFGSAEERMVYNKTHNIEKYDGILVEYEYRLIDLGVKSKSEWLLVCQNYFSGLVDVEVYAVNGVNYFSALTAGSRTNHDSSYSLPVDLGYKIEFTRRKYHLK